MPRSVTVSLPTDRAGVLVDDLTRLDGLLTLSRQRQVSIMPEGDVVTVEVLDRSVSALFELLARHGAGDDEGVSVTSTEPTAVISASSSVPLSRDPSTSSLEEVESTLEREATMGANKLIAMGAAGAIAVVGIVQNSVHLVIGAMVIAPGFEPFLKLGLRVTGRTRSFRRGAFDLGAGWSSLVAGAAVGALMLRLLGVPVDSSAGGYLSEGSLLTYWRSLTLTGTLVAVVAGLTGTILVVSNRAVLTAGVMIALGLVPGAALVGLGIVHADLGLTVDGAVRWAHDAFLVTALGCITFAALRTIRGRGMGRAGDEREPT